MKPLIVLSIPGLRTQDLDRMPRLRQTIPSGSQRSWETSFPAVTWSAQANMITGKLANEHGIIGNGFFWRDHGRVEMWTAGNEVIEREQVWDALEKSGVSTAVWFPMLAKRSGASYACMPAPVHNPDGTESLWCYTKPQEFYRTLLEKLSHFPLQHFWGPLAGIASTRWIAQSAVLTAQSYQPKFWFIYLPHLDYAAQKLGPDSPQALKAVEELDQVIGELSDGMQAAYGEMPAWMALSEYVITAVDHVSYPNRELRRAGLLQLDLKEGLEYLNPAQSKAWALVDHQFSHVFVRDHDAEVIEQVAQWFKQVEGIEEVLVGEERDRYGMHHARSGDVLLISRANSWQAYYWWEDDACAPDFARKVDIHRKPGYDRSSCILIRRRVVFLSMQT